MPIRAFKSGQPRALRRQRLLLLALPALACALTQCAGGGAPDANVNQRAPEAGVQAMAEKLFGPKVRVLLTGDLAHNGRYQVLVLDPRAASAGVSASSVAFWRAAILQKENTGWREVLRCDEYLKNSSGYLRGTPRAPVTGWQLQVSAPDDKRGRELSFTPLQGQDIVPVPAIQVRWNPKVDRYQSFDVASKTFLGELPLLETPASELR